MDDSTRVRSGLISELARLRLQIAELASATAGQAGPSGTSNAAALATQDALAELPGDNGGAPTNSKAAIAPPSGASVRWGEEKTLLKEVVANVPIIVWALDRDGVFMLSEGKNLEALGLKPAEVVGRSVDDLYGDIPEIMDGVRRALAGESVTQTVEVDGIIFASWHSPLRNSADEVVGTVGVAVDVTEHEQAKAELLVEQRFMGRMLRSHERDRRLIGYEIHDGLVQDVTGAQMHLESLLRSGQLPAGPARDELELVLDLVRKAVSQSRELIGGLRPPILDKLGVVSAIESLIEDQQSDGPLIELTVDEQFDRLEPLLERGIYRIVQEAITNIRRHSKSDRAEIRLVQVCDRIQLEIRDWGVGFAPAMVKEKRFGLQGIRERARLLEGRAVIESAPGEGTRVFVDLPIAGAPKASYHHERLES